MRFTALRIANQIVSNTTDWWWDNCKVQPRSLQAKWIQMIVLAYVGRLSESQIFKAWRTAAVDAHSAAVDRIAYDATPYAVACFKNRLSEMTTMSEM